MDRRPRAAGLQRALQIKRANGEANARFGQQLQQGARGRRKNDQRAIGNQKCGQARSQASFGRKCRRTNDKQYCSMHGRHVVYCRIQIGRKRERKRALSIYIKNIYIFVIHYLLTFEGEGGNSFILFLFD